MSNPKDPGSIHWIKVKGHYKAGDPPEGSTRWLVGTWNGDFGYWDTLGSDDTISDSNILEVGPEIIPPTSLE